MSERNRDRERSSTCLLSEQADRQRTYTRRDGYIVCVPQQKLYTGSPLASCSFLARCDSKHTPRQSKRCLLFTLPRVAVTSPGLPASPARHFTPTRLTSVKQVAPGARLALRRASSYKHHRHHRRSHIRHPAHSDENSLFACDLRVTHRDARCREKPSLPGGGDFVEGGAIKTSML